MRDIALALALFTVLFASSYRAAAQIPAKPVEVINLPEVQDVNVLNVPPAAAAARFQFVGFTTDSFPGDLGGLFGGHNPAPNGPGLLYNFLGVVHVPAPVSALIRGHQKHGSVGRCSTSYAAGGR